MRGRGGGEGLPSQREALPAAAGGTLGLGQFASAGIMRGAYPAPPWGSSGKSTKATT